MLDPWIIEEILRRERERDDALRRQPEALPLSPPPIPRRDTVEEEPDRGVVTIEIAPSPNTEAA